MLPPLLPHRQRGVFSRRALRPLAPDVAGPPILGSEMAGSLRWCRGTGQPLSMKVLVAAGGGSARFLVRPGSRRDARLLDAPHCSMIRMLWVQRPGSSHGTSAPQPHPTHDAPGRLPPTRVRLQLGSSFRGCVDGVGEPRAEGARLSPAHYVRLGSRTGSLPATHLSAMRSRASGEGADLPCRVCYNYDGLNVIDGRVLHPSRATQLLLEREESASGQ
jgi:hypothetical protein